MKKRLNLVLAMVILFCGASAQATVVLDQQQLNQNTTTSTGITNLPQQEFRAYSFTAGITGTLKQIDILCFEGQSGSIFLNVYEGVSIQALLDQSDMTIIEDGWVSFYEDAPVISGQISFAGFSRH